MVALIRGSPRADGAARYWARIRARRSRRCHCRWPQWSWPGSPAVFGNSRCSRVPALGPRLAGCAGTIARPPAHPDVQAIGVFGSADASMPWPGYALWLLALAGVGTAALVVGGRRERLSVLGLVGGTLVVVLGMSLVYREIGRLQGRYALPVLVLLPLWLGEVVHRRRAWLSDRATRILAGGALGVVAVVQLIGLAVQRAPVRSRTERHLGISRRGTDGPRRRTGLRGLSWPWRGRRARQPRRSPLFRRDLD